MVRYFVNLFTVDNNIREEPRFEKWVKIAGLLALMSVVLVGCSSGRVQSRVRQVQKRTKQLAARSLAGLHSRPTQIRKR